MNDDNDGVVKCQKNSTTPPRCHSDQVDPLVTTEIDANKNTDCLTRKESIDRICKSYCV